MCQARDEEFEDCGFGHGRHTCEGAMTDEYGAMMKW
jgi:hypothetical protein